MIYVVDASLAVKWFVKEELHEAAVNFIRSDREFVAPDLILLELPNAVWKKYRRGETTAEQALQVLPRMRQLLTRLLASGDFAERALELALLLRHPIYDCVYLACAERHEGTLVTADRRLLDAVAGTRWRDVVCHLALLGDRP